jgi:hypothetical protein
MKWTVNKSVRFVNIITDISQCFVDIYQSAYQDICIEMIFSTGTIKKSRCK